jgi:N-acetylmuramoyl-L-alanine amidase
MNNSNYLWLIDAGHGGINALGVYTTAPYKMKKFKDFNIYEGVINRIIAALLYKQLQQVGIDFHLIFEDVVDTPLSHRIALANKATAKQHDLYQRKCILISIHSNAGEGKGFEVFTSFGQNESDIVAERLCRIYKKNFPEFPYKRVDLSDGDMDKEANFAMVGGNKKFPLLCPAVLAENLFFDEINQAEFLLSAEGQQRIADSLMEWITDIELTKPI